MLLQRLQNMTVAGYDLNIICESLEGMSEIVNSIDFCLKFLLN